MLHQPDKVIKRYNAESTSHLSELGVLIVFFVCLFFFVFCLEGS